MKTAALVVLLSTMAVSGAAQWLNYAVSGTPRTKDGKPDLTARAPKMPDGKSDLSGIWHLVATKKSRDRHSDVGPNLLDFIPEGADIPFLPEGAALYKQRSEKLGASRPSEHCLPHGIPDAMTISDFKLVQNPGLTLILYEEFNHYRQIFTDNRPFPKDLEPAWFGSSIGRWDGDTFVVETRGFNDKSWLDDYGHPHSDALVAIERFQRRDFGHMDLQITIDDPKMYSKPWSFTFNLALLPDTDLIESICDNEKDVQHAPK
jgi:hypothetical protein